MLRVTVWLLLAASASAAAQTASDPRGYVAVKGGANHEEAEDGLVATTAAAGIAAGLSLSPAWTTEFEVWLPAYIRDGAGDPKHRDVQFSVSLVRSFSAGGLRPYVLGGLSAARTVSFLTACVADRLPYPPVAGAQPAPTIVSCSEFGVYQRHRERFASISSYFLLGTGFEVPLGRRIRLAPEVRMHVAAASVIVRPALGLVLGF